MGDLEEFVPLQPKTTEAIYAAWKKKGDAEPPRQYVGASEIGEPCSRKLWYKFRWCGKEPLSGRMYRLFNHGHVEEDRIVADLKAIGYEIYAVGADGEQFGIVDCDGHFKGHMDGAVLGVLEAPKTWHVFEGKTHSAKSFGDLTRRGVQRSKPKHYAQVQVYMSKSGMKRALYVAINKNTDEVYTERIRLDHDFADSLIQKAKRIICSPEPMLKAGDNPGAKECEYCIFTSLCHGNPTGAAVPVVLSCRTCVRSTPVAEGRWECDRLNKMLSVHDQWRMCPYHLLIPSLIPFAEPVDYGKNPDGSDYIEFMNEADNSSWRHGRNKEDGQFSSKELTITPKSALHGLSGDRIQSLKAKFGGEVVG